MPPSHTYAISYFTGKRVFYTMSARNYEKLAAFFPVLTTPPEKLVDEYDVNLVLVDNAVVSVSGIDLKGYRQVMEKND